MTISPPGPPGSSAPGEAVLLAQVCLFDLLPAGVQLQAVLTAARRVLQMRVWNHQAAPQPLPHLAALLLSPASSPLPPPAVTLPGGKLDFLHTDQNQLLQNRQGENKRNHQ